MRWPETLKYLFDISESCRLLDEFTSRQFEIIGEALRLAIALEPELAGLISNSSRIIAFRNRLIHGYANRRAA
jgi:hypothetical protein